MIVWKNTNEAVVKMVPKSHWYLNLELFFFSQQKVETPFPPHCYYTMCLEKEEAICLVSECATDVFFFFFLCGLYQGRVFVDSFILPFRVLVHN